MTRTAVRQRARSWHGSGPGAVATALLVVAGLAVSVVAAPTGAGAQDLTERLEQLEQEREQLDGEIADAEADLASAQERIEERRAALARTSVELELLADEYAATVEARRQPERLRLLIGVDAYIRGDPRITSLLADILRMETRSRDQLHRELYRAVVELADARLDSFDRELRAMARRVRQHQSSMSSLRDDLEAARADRDAATAERDELVARRAEVAREIEDVRARANRAVLTGVDGFENPDRAALAVKIDNVRAARPQAGINEADVVFEELVEGGLSRLAAVYHSSAPQVGPVRSVRSTDMNVLALLDRPLLASSGGNPGVRAELAASPLVDVGVTEHPDLYRRERGRRPPHNLFTDAAALWEAAQGAGGRPSALFSYRDDEGELPSSAIAIQGVSIDYGRTTVDYEWDGSRWVRSQDGRAHTDAAGTRVAPVNVVVQFTNYRPSRVDARSPEAVVTGSGEAWILTEGHLVRGRWNRPEPGDITTYADEDGDPIELTPGVTWVALPPPGTTSVR